MCTEMQTQGSNDLNIRVISNLMGILKDTCAEIYKLSGWSTIALTGGPNPALNNKIALQTLVTLFAAVNYECY